MAISNPYEQYQKLAVNTLTPCELIVLLYDEVSLCLNNAMLDIKKNRLNHAHTSIIKAENIILYLIDILDMNYPISDKLLQIYEFIYRQMVKANVEKNPVILEEILSMTDNLKDTWKQVENINRQKTKF